MRRWRLDMRFDLVDIFLAAQLYKKPTSFLRGWLIVSLR